MIKLIHRRLIIFLYIIIAFLFWVSLFIYIPTLSTYIQDRTSNLAMVGVVLSMYGLWQALVRIPLGFVSDWLGLRKPFIIAGILLAGSGAWLMGVSEGVPGLLVGRALTGLAAGAWVPFIVVFSDLFAPHEAIRATTMITLANSGGRVLATAMTGPLNAWQGETFIFFLAAGIAGLALLLLLPIPEMRRPTQPPSLANLGRLFYRRDVLIPTLLAALLQYVNWTATLSFIPILVKDLGGTEMTQSLFVSVNIGVVIIGNLTTMVIINRFGAQRLLYLGFSLLALGLAITALAPSLTLLFMGQFTLGLAEGVTYPALMGLTIQYVVDSERMTAMGIHQAVYAIGTFAGPWISGLIADLIGLQPMFGVTAGMCFVCSFWIISQLRPPQGVLMPQRASVGDQP